ncbi:MAG: hypothetical protein K2P17_05960 [Helicobacteraceae bacterium]|nr:hypothetical protein [Helicobacteraceae bacterium]
MNMGNSIKFVQKYFTSQLKRIQNLVMQYRTMKLKKISLIILEIVNTLLDDKGLWKLNLIHNAYIPKQYYDIFYKIF